VNKYLPVIFTFLLFFTLTQASCQNKILINDSLVYQFMNGMKEDHYGAIQKDEIFSNKPTNIRDYMREPGVLKYFSVEDTAFMRDQIDSRFNFKWDSLKMKDHFRVVDDRAIDKCFAQRTDGWDLFKKKFGNGYSDYSIPLFSKDMKRVFIYKGYHCGWLCGDGYIYIFEKQAGAWKMIYLRMIWIS
jgi:hypothetical protein